MFGIRARLDRRKAARQRRAPLARGWLNVGQTVHVQSQADYYVVGTVSYVGLVNPADGVFMFHLAEFPAEAFASDRIITPRPRPQKGVTV